MTAIDTALEEVNKESTIQGANQNRFAAVISTLNVSIENQTTAKSRIMDTDYAAETAHLARSQVLQQAGMAMLAQANQLPNGVMALMR
jgi:flagellin